MAEILIKNGEARIRGGAEVFQLLAEFLKTGSVPYSQPKSKETKTEAEKKKPVKGVSRAPKPEGGGSESISKEEMRKIQQIIKEVVPNGK